VSFPLFLLLLVTTEPGNQDMGCHHYLGIEEMLLYRCPEGVRPEPYHWTASSTVQKTLIQEILNLKAPRKSLT